jgi:hypothetical protein
MESLLAWSMDHGSAAAQWRGHTRKAGSVRFREGYHLCSIEERPGALTRLRQGTADGGARAAQKGPCGARRRMKDLFLFSAVYRPFADS